MAEVRTTSSTGGQKGVKLQRFDLIPIGPLTALAEHYGIGASKYANHQWRQGYEWSKSYAALLRHLTAFWNGFDLDVCSNDPEGCSHVDTDGTPFVAVREDACFNHTGNHHLAAVAWHAFCLMEFSERFPQHDDRYRPEEREPTEDEETIAYLREELRKERAARKLVGDLLHDGLTPYTDEELEENAHAAPPVPAVHEGGDGVPLPEGWQNLGYISADGGGFAKFDLVGDLKPYQDALNAEITRLAQMAVAPRLFIPPLEPERVEIGRNDLWVLPEDAQVEWLDPEPMTLAAVAKALQKLHAASIFEDNFRPLPRFTVGSDGTTSDARYPLSAQEEKWADQGWRVLGELSGNRLWHRPDNLGYATEWTHNAFAVRRPEEYDDSFLRDRGVLDAFFAGPDLLSKRRATDLINDSWNPA